MRKQSVSPNNAPNDVLDLVARLMPLLLEGADPKCAAVRAQYERATVREVLLSGVGFFVRFDVPSEVPRVDFDFSGCDAAIALERVEHGAGCVLFIRNGVLTTLEVFTYADAWPDPAVVVSIQNVLTLADAALHVNR